MSYSDEEILHRVQAGNAELFHVIFERHYARIAGFVRRSLHEAEDCKDVVAEVFVRAFQSAHQFDAASGTPYVAYLYAIAHNLLVDRLRQSRADDVKRASLAEEERDRDGSPLEQMLRRESIERVRRALARLPVDHQQIIHLAFDDDLNSRDIARIMNKPSVTAVTSHLHRALQALRKTLEADGYFGELSERGGERNARARKVG